MSNVNDGAQLIHWNFQEQETSANFNVVLRDIIKPGISQGGLLSIVGANTLQIAPFIAYIRSADVGNDKGIHLTTQAAVTQLVPNTPNGDFTLYVTYTYVASLNNFADFNVRTTASPPVANECRIGRVINNGSGTATTISYSNRSRGSVDVSASDQLTADTDPTQGWHVGNRDYQDLRYVKKTGAGPFDIQVLNTTDASQPSSITASNTATRAYSLQDRSGTLALSYETLRLGMIVDSMFPITPSANDPFFDIALTSTPGSTIANLSSTGSGSYPLLVPALRALQMNVQGNLTFAVTGYSVVTPGAVARLQFDTSDGNGVINTLLLNAMQEDNLYHGSGTPTFLNWRCITLPSAIGNIVAGDYVIVGINTASKTIDIQTTITSGAGSGSVSFYPFRIAGSTTTARWFIVSDSVIQSVGGNQIPLLRVRDELQLHGHTNNNHSHTVPGTFITFGTGPQAEAGFGGFNGSTANPPTSSVSITIKDPVDSGSGAGTPRVGTTTRARGIVGYKYIYAGVFQP